MTQRKCCRQRSIRLDPQLKFFFEQSDAGVIQGFTSPHYTISCAFTACAHKRADSSATQCYLRDTKLLVETCARPTHQLSRNATLERGLKALAPITVSESTLAAYLIRIHQVRLRIAAIGKSDFRALE